MEDVRGNNRTATLGSKDKKFSAKRERSLKGQQVLEAKWSTNSESLTFATATTTSSESECETAFKNQNLILGKGTGTSSNAVNSARSKETSSGAYLIADKYGLPNIALTELTGVFQKSAGKNLDHLYLSVNIIRRRETNTRKSTATDFILSELRDISQKRFALHWDCKLIKSPTHDGKDVEE